jgi:hypothetical protein
MSGTLAGEKVEIRQGREWVRPVTTNDNGEVSLDVLQLPEAVLEGRNLWMELHFDRKKLSAPLGIRLPDSVPHEIRRRMQLQ